MKKILVSLVVFGSVASFAYAERNIDFVDYSKSALTRLVAHVLDLNEKGFSSDQIVNDILDNKKEFIKNDLYKQTKKVQKKYQKALKKYRKSLRKGDEGDDVAEMQRKLNRLAAKLGIQSIHLTDDGKYGPATAYAVRLFQRYQGLDDDGVVGPQTFGEMDDNYDENENDFDQENDDENDQENDFDQENENEND